MQAEIDKFNLDMLGYGLEEQLKEIKKSMAAGRVEEDELAEENNRLHCVNRGKFGSSANIG